MGYQLGTVSGIVCSCEFHVTGLGSIVLKMRYFLQWITRYVQYLVLCVAVNFLLQDWGALSQKWNIFIEGYHVSTVSGIVCSCEFLVTGLGSIILK